MFLASLQSSYGSKHEVPLAAKEAEAQVASDAFSRTPGLWTPGPAPAALRLLLPCTSVQNGNPVHSKGAYAYLVTAGASLPVPFIAGISQKSKKGS